MSLYESGSEDGSNVWLHLLKLLLCQIQVPFKVDLLAQIGIKPSLSVGNSVNEHQDLVIMNLSTVIIPCSDCNQRHLEEGTGSQFRAGVGPD